MSKNKVLVIGMLDSIHIARWLEQFVGSDFKIYLFPSSHFQIIHPKLLQINSSEIRVFGVGTFGKYIGYIDSIITFRLFGAGIAKKTRGFILKLFLLVARPKIIHAIEIQHAGYLVSSIRGSAERRIITNWGSDIYFFQNYSEHRIKIINALKWATHYSAECDRDYKLAQKLGFIGVNLPKIPNAGGFEEFKNQNLCSSRKLILVKTYGGQFGAGNIAIESLSRFLNENQDFKVFFYSVTPDLVIQVEELIARHPKLVNYSTLKNPISHERLMDLFLTARIYLGCSVSDGLSTSFLQSICTGAYPIQTNTSCASELIFQGASGSVIGPFADEIYSELRSIVVNESLLDAAQAKNLEFSRAHLDRLSISEKAKSFYLE
jgi:hypothetical protein